MPKTYPFRAFGFEFQLPFWAVTLLAAVVVTGTGYYVWDAVYGKTEKQLVSMADVNKQLSAEVEEYGLHVMEEPEKHELFEDADGKLLLRVYKDHCVLIQRQSRRGTKTKLVMDLERSVLAPLKAAVPPVIGNHFTATATLYAAEQQQNPCARGCLNPHPNPFQWRYGNQVGNGWVEVIRWWPEGCSHIQLFNPQSGAWDSNPDGTARVRWTCCVH